MREKKLSRLTKTGSAALVSSVIGMMTVGAAFANDKQTWCMLQVTAGSPNTGKNECANSVHPPPPSLLSVPPN